MAKFHKIWGTMAQIWETYGTGLETYGTILRNVWVFNRWIGDFIGSLIG
jgi:hypothetical protein